jgi:DNA-binding LacI/PurR family transcriptional regulator
LIKSKHAMTTTTTPQSDSGSKITHIQDHFRTQIRKGTLVAGDRLPPERQLANTFGVSLLTVNKAMAGLESEMLLDRQTSRGTFIHPDVSRGQVMVVFDTRHFANPEIAGFYHRLLEALTGAVKSRGMRPIHILGHGDPGDDFIASIEPQSTIWRQCAGVLAMAGLEHFEDQLTQMGIPAVTLTTLPTQGLHPVVLDMAGLVRRAYGHLVKRGCKRIALISNVPITNRYYLLEYAGRATYPLNLLEQLEQQGPGIATHHIRSGCRTPKLGYEAMASLWQESERPDGVIVSDDNTATGVAAAVHDLHIDTPTQLKLIAHATAGVEREDPLNMTRCQFDLKRICRGAFGLLYRLMLHERNADRLIIKAAIRQGDTT